MKKHVSQDTPRLMRISDACRYLGVSRNFIQRLLDNNHVPCIRLDGYKLRILKSDLDKWVRKNRMNYERVEPLNKEFGKPRKRHDLDSA